MNSQPESTRRLFFALTPPAEVRARIACAADALSLGAAARRVAPERYHLTVAFAGQVDAAQWSAVQCVGARQRARRFDLALAAYEYWPKPEVVVAAAREIPTPLEGLWRALHGDLAALGLALDPKRLRPHVTLARKVAEEPRLPAMAALGWRADSFSLMRSDTAGTEPIYTVLDTWPLLDEE